MLMQISNLVIQDMWEIVSVLQFWEHIIGGIFLIWLFCTQRWLIQMLITLKKCKKQSLTVYNLFDLNRLLSTTMVHYRNKTWQHLVIILYNIHPCHKSLHNLTFVMNKTLQKLFLKEHTCTRLSFWIQWVKTLFDIMIRLQHYPWCLKWNKLYILLWHSMA